MSKFGTFVLGGAIGAAIALLYAPRPGDQTRALVTEKVNAVWGEAKDWGAGAASSGNAQALFQDVAARGQELARGVASQANEAIEAASSRIQEATGQAPAPAYSGDSDELREKIEAARQRIAAQVMKNAEESRAAAPLDVPAVQEVVEAAEDVAEAVGEAVGEVAEAAGQAVESVLGQE